MPKKAQKVPNSKLDLEVENTNIGSAEISVNVHSHPNCKIYLTYQPVRGGAYHMQIKGIIEQSVSTSCSFSQFQNSSRCKKNKHKPR